MPNWCYNELSVWGEENDIKAFRKLAKSRKTKRYDATDLSLAKLYPEPDYNKVKVKPTFPKISKNKGKYVDKETAWWDWRVQNWGTKWNVKAILEDKNEGYLHYTFDSAWSPPSSWLKKIAKDWPDLEFRLKYDEQGMGFMGVTTAKNGKAKDNCMQY